jgi:hypothetical protein
MLSVVLALTILSLPLVLARISSSNKRDADRPELAPVRVRAQRPQIERRRVR